MKNKRNVLYGLATIIVGLIYFSGFAQQKNAAHRVSFSGEWRTKESIAMDGNIVCCYNSGDRMLAKTMNITEQVNCLTVEVSSAFPGTAPVTSREKLTFDGKPGVIDYGPGRGKKFTVKLSADGRTMTVNSTVHLTMVGQKQSFVYVTEIWKLSNDGRTISVQASARSGVIGRERLWETVFNKVG
ncbi:MAG TPA: hypothetical protein VHA56_09825 [Mucilaginibacter sp.]|nr:hypothetical protein [Mucilaginibacter sp.]